MSEETHIKKSDELRHRIVTAFDKFKEHLEAYHEYAEQVAALGLEYQMARFEETYPGVPLVEMVAAVTLDTRSTPASVDKALASFRESGKIPKQILVDRFTGHITVFV